MCMLEAQVYIMYKSKVFSDYMYARKTVNSKELSHMLDIGFYIIKQDCTPDIPDICSTDICLHSTSLLTKTNKKLVNRVRAKAFFKQLQEYGWTVNYEGHTNESRK